MATTTNLTTLKINYLTQAQYDDALENEEINENELYFTPNAGSAIPTKLSDLTNDMVVSDFPNDAGYSTQTIYASTVLPTSADGQEGDIWFVYTPSTT